MTEHLKADLLRRRREELGLQAAPAAPSQQLLRRGVLLGIAPLVLVLLLGMFFWWRESQLRAVVATLEPVANEYDALQSSLGRQRAQLKKLQQSNEALVKGLLSVPSSSALLAELARLTPQGVQLTTMSALGSTMTLNGEAIDPAAFIRINAFQLALQTSPFFQAPARLQRPQGSRRRWALTSPLISGHRSRRRSWRSWRRRGRGLAARFERLSRGLDAMTNFQQDNPRAVLLGSTPERALGGVARGCGGDVCLDPAGLCGAFRAHQ